MDKSVSPILVSLPPLQTKATLPYLQSLSDSCMFPALCWAPKWALFHQAAKRTDEAYKTGSEQSSTWQRVWTRPKLAQMEAEQQLSTTPELHILWFYTQNSHKVHQHGQNQNPRIGQVKRDHSGSSQSTQHRIVPSWFWNISREWNSTTPLSKLFQVLPPVQLERVPAAHLVPWLGLGHQVTRIKLPFWSPSSHMDENQRTGYTFHSCASIKITL